MTSKRQRRRRWFEPIGWLTAALAILGTPGFAPPLAAQGDTPLLRLYVLTCGYNHVDDVSVYSPGVDVGVSKDFVVSCYVIKHERGILLWGTGLNDGLIDKPEGITAANGNFHLSIKRTLRSQLAELGIEPEDVTYVSMSHMHPDHSGNGNLFTASTLILQEEEYDAAFGDEPQRYAFNPAFYGKLKDSKTIRLKGDHDVFGDGRVIVKRAIGHTPGHQCLFIDFHKMGPVLLSGDLWHFMKNRVHRRVPKFNFDKEATLRSMEEIERFAAERGANIWIEHDAEFNAAIPHAPAYHE